MSAESLRSLCSTQGMVVQIFSMEKGKKECLGYLNGLESAREGAMTAYTTLHSAPMGLNDHWFES